VGKTTVLVGNPNVGKSVLFKNLTRRYVTVSNYPGTTVEVVRAKAAFDGREIEVVDTPGVNDLAPRSDEARVTRKLLDETAGATIVQVADAKNLRRALLLTLQLAELEQPTVLVLNMYDELEERGRQIDTARLSEILGIPVVVTVAPQNQGTQELIDALPHAAVPRVPAEVLAPTGDDYGHNRVLLAHANEILGQTYSVARPPHPSVRVRLGLMAMHPVKGIGVLAAILFTVFWFVGLFGAGTLVDLLEVGVFEQRLNPLVIGATDAVLPFPHAHDTEVLTYSFGIPARHRCGPERVATGVALRARLPGRPLRGDHDGAGVRVCHRAAHCHGLLPGVQHPGRLGLLPAHGDHGEPRVPRDGPQREGRPAYDPGARL
jgi:ferrous iron transport protein B